MSVLTLPLAALALLVCQAPERPAVDEEPPPLLGRVVVVGASVSYGHGLARELETARDVPLGRFLGSVLGLDDERVVDLGDTWFFRAPAKRGRAQLDAALAAEPTVVVAVDFLFWYAFGNGYANEEHRLQYLDRGLAELDRIECPIVVGDFPDVRAALEGKGPFGMPLVTPDMIPSEEGRARLNERLAAWAAERERVAVVPIADMLASMRTGEELTLRGNEWRPEELEAALQPDLLHPTVRGTRWVALAIVDVLARAHEEVEAWGGIAWSDDELERRVLAATEDERRAERERRERRAERQRRADEQRDGEREPLPVR